LLTTPCRSSLFVRATRTNRMRLLLASALVAVAAGCALPDEAQPRARSATGGRVAVGSLQRAARSGDDIVVLRAPSSESVLIRAGSFMMGSTETEIQQIALYCSFHDRKSEDCHPEWFGDEAEMHLVHLDAYWIDRTEVTVAAYERCVEAGVCREPPYLT